VHPDYYLSVNKHTISVFGSTGFIGSHFLNFSKNPVVAMKRDDRQSLTSRILYFIGTNHNYNVLENYLLDVQVNLVHFLEVLNASRTLHKELEINFVSSWFVYGDGEIPYKESQHCNPKGFYSITKYTAEMLLQSYCRTFGLNYRIIRLGNVFGPGDKSASSKKNALQFLVRRIQNNESIDLYEGGEIVRDFIHVTDVVQGLDLILNKSELDQIYNLGSGVPTNMGKLLKEYAEETNSESLINSKPTPEFHKVVQVKDAYLDIEKVRSLGFKISLPISPQALKELL
jgi:nucleoside-diphosphate-sugar epimerase